MEAVERPEEKMIMEAVERPEAKMIGEDGNVFNLISIASRALKRAGYSARANEMTEEIFSSSSYDEALQIMQKYVVIV